MADQNVITNEDGQFRSAEGTRAVNAFRYRTLIVGLKFEQETGRSLARGRTCRQIAKRESGLKTNDYDRLIAWANERMQAEIAACTIVNR